MVVEATLTVGKLLEDYGISIVIWNVKIAIYDLSKYEPNTQLLVNVKMEISNQPEIIEISQIRSYNDIIVGTPNILPLEGKLFLNVSFEDTKLVSYDAVIYYVEKIEG